MWIDSRQFSVPQEKSCFGQDFVFEKVTEDAGKLLEIVEKEGGLGCFAKQSCHVVKQLFARGTRRHSG